MIFPWNRRGGLLDFRRFEASLRRSDRFPLISAQFDRLQRRDLYSLRMSGGAKCHKEARSTGRAKKETLILKGYAGSITLQFCGYNHFPSSVSFTKIPESFRNLT
jgi:hypothetical protein